MRAEERGVSAYFPLQKGDQAGGVAWATSPTARLQAVSRPVLLPRRAGCSASVAETVRARRAASTFAARRAANPGLLAIGSLLDWLPAQTPQRAIGCPMAGTSLNRRTLAVVRDRSGRDLAVVMIREGHARTYHGRGPRGGWCDVG